MPAWLEALNVFKPVVEGIISNRKHKRELKHEIHKAKQQRIREGQLAEVEWNTQALKGRDWITGWFVLLLSIPLVGAFIPAMVPAILAGFNTLGEMPIWYQGGVGAAMALAFGAKQLQNISMNRAYSLPAKVHEPKKNKH